MAAIAQGRFGATFSLALEGFDSVTVAVSRFGENIRDWRPFWRDYFAPDFYGRIARNFELEGKLAGGWQPLESRYAAWKAAHYPGKTILRRTDRLFNSISWTGDGPGPEGIFRADPSSLELGTSVPYAKWHQLGAVLHQRFISAATLPRRPFLFLVPGMRSTIGRLLHAWAFDRMRAAGLGGPTRSLSTSRFL